MLTHTPAFETLATAPIKTTDVIVVRQQQDPYGYVEDPTAKWASSDVLMSVNVDCVGDFLSTVTKKATVKLLGIVDTAVAGDVFRVELGIYNADPSVSGFDYTCVGYYIVDNITYDYDAYSTTVTMYDHMWAAKNTPYSDTSNTSGDFTFPATVEELAIQMAGAIGVDLMASFSSLPNASYSIPIDPYSNISNATIQSVIQEIAGATGTTARITDTTLVFSQYDPLDYDFGSNELKTLNIGKEYGPVTSVVLGRVPQNDNIVLSNSVPTSNIISSIDTGTDLITITANGLNDGDLVRIESDDTLPVPLQPNTNYFVYTNGSANTFALAPTYADGLAGTNLIDLTSSGAGNITLSHLATQEVQINNNQIVDKDRQTLLPILYENLVGIEWHEVKTDTVGLGWFEVGDVINFTQGSTTVKAFLAEIHLTLAGSIKENFISVIPDVATINYQTAGGILKTIYDTEIIVDKQGNDITSIVSEQQVFENETNTNFTEIYQNLTDILLTVQKSGGGNLVLNSVGFATESATDGDNVNFQKLSFWYYNHDYTAGPLPTDGTTDANSLYQIDTQGTVTSYSSGESQNAGGISGQVIEINGDGLILEQYIPVAVGVAMCFGVMVKKALADGGGTITIYNDNETRSVTIDDMTSYVWEELKIENFTSTMPWVKMKIESSSAVHWQITDLRLFYGTTLQGWQQSASEILATNVQFSKLGMKIFDNVHDTETQVTYNEFSTRRRTDGKILFEADDSGVITNDLTIRGVTNYVDADDNVVIKQITIPKSNARAGIAFIKVS
jgi:hypothetical protein